MSSIDPKCPVCHEVYNRDKINPIVDGAARVVNGGHASKNQGVAGIAVPAIPKPQPAPWSEEETRILKEHYKTEVKKNETRSVKLSFNKIWKNISASLATAGYTRSDDACRACHQRINSNKVSQENDYSGEHFNNIRNNEGQAIFGATSTNNTYRVIQVQSDDETSNGAELSNMSMPGRFSSYKTPEQQARLESEYQRDRGASSEDYEASDKKSHLERKKVKVRARIFFGEFTSFKCR